MDGNVFYKFLLQWIGQGQRCSVGACSCQVARKAPALRCRLVAHRAMSAIIKYDAGEQLPQRRTNRSQRLQTAPRNASPSRCAPPPTSTCSCRRTSEMPAQCHQPSPRMLDTSALAPHQMVVVCVSATLGMALLTCIHMFLVPAGAAWDTHTSIGTAWDRDLRGGVSCHLQRHQDVQLRVIVEPARTHP